MRFVNHLGQLTASVCASEALPNQIEALRNWAEAVPSRQRVTKGWGGIGFVNAGCWNRKVLQEPAGGSLGLQIKVVAKLR